MTKQHLHYTVIGVGCVVGIALLAWYFWPSESERVLEPPQVLAKKLDSASDSKQKVAAARDLVRHGQAARTEVRAALAQHQRYEPEVVAPLAQAAMVSRDYPSMPTLIELLDHEDARVRGRAGAAVTKILGADFGYRANMPPRERAEVIAKIRADYEVAKDRLPVVYGRQ